MIDLHVHLGGAVPAAVLWEILCDGGLQTEFGSFDKLQDYLTVRFDEILSLDDFLGRYFHATELIQSSPHAASVAAYQAIAKAYRRSRIQGMELRYNPLKRIREGMHTLDSIIMATIQGLQRASLHYGVKTGILFSLDKGGTLEGNWSIVEEAMRFRGQGGLRGAYGIVGIDIAGPESLGREHDKDWLAHMAAMFDEARKVGLGLSWHVGETAHTGPEAMINVIETIRPDRIGHGIELRKAQGKQRDHLCGLLRERQICLEICPTVNLVTRSIQDLKEIADLIRLLDKEHIPFCLNTDNPYIVNTNLQREYDLIAEVLGDDAHLLDQAKSYADQASFLQERA
tara:strand:- start:66439 stop:67464 length:1026 start_codon:yes stop_codon:yes gene_type:complete